MASMGIIADTKATIERIPRYANEMKKILSRHDVRTALDLKRLANEPAFQTELAGFWESMVKAEGAKFTLTVATSIIALSLGGLGIATLGGAIGLPWIAILAPAGYLAGQEIDSQRYTRSAIDRIKKVFRKQASS